MTTKEQAKLRRLELENEQLRQQHMRHIEVYRDQSIELIDLRAQIQLMREILQDGAP